MLAGFSLFTPLNGGTTKEFKIYDDLIFDIVFPVSLSSFYVLSFLIRYFELKFEGFILEPDILDVTEPSTFLESLLSSFLNSSICW